MTDKKVKVGVTLRVGGEMGQQSIWENGIFQNCFFLAKLLSRAPHVSESYVVLCGSASKETKEAFVKQVKCDWMHEEEAAAKLDIIIEMSINLGEHLLPAFQGRGGKLIGAKVGNDYVIDVERVIFGLDPASLVRPTKYAATWTIPEYEEIGVDYYEALYRAPVKVLPHLWSPSIIQNVVMNKGFDFMYRKGALKPHARVAIFEPNICMVKTSFVPLLICDALYRSKPDAFRKVMAFNTRGMAESSKAFNDFASTLDISASGVVTYEGRLATYEVMAKYANIVVSHQIENAQNYLYYELLWAGYPLVHNSHLLGDCGYRYHDFNTREGARALLNAITSHDLKLDEYNAKAAAFINGLSPTNPRNIALYDDALVEVINS